MDDAKKLAIRYRELIKQIGGTDITCLDDKTIVKEAFKYLNHKIYDEVCSEALIDYIDRELKGDWENGE